jgi:hypothetical protein
MPDGLEQERAPKTFFVPGAPLAGKNLKKGDRLNLEVVFVDPENKDVEVKIASDSEPTAEEQLRPMLANAFPQNPMT